MRELITMSLVAVLAMTAGAFLYQTLSGNDVSAAAQQASPPDSAPGFTLKDVNGNERSDKEWQGKYQLLNFWATWCPPCRREIPMLKEMQDLYGEKGLQVIGIAIDQVESVAEYQKEIQMNYPILVGQMDATRTADVYGNSIGALPYSVLVAPDGKILFSRMGELEREPFVAVLEAIPAFSSSHASPE